MRLRSLAIENFKAIRCFEVGNLADLVVIAGPNGCGKSVVLDAIRLLKSVYGGYQYDEWRQWYAEFHINVDRPEDAQRLFRDASRPLVVAAEIELAPEERAYVDANAESLVEPIVWRRLLGRDVGAIGGGSISMELREYKARVDELVAEGVRAVRDDLDRDLHPIRVAIQPGGRLEPTPRAPLVEVVFPTYQPQHLGIIDYHSPNRSYQRETVGTVQLALSAQEEQRRNYALYNPQSKYANIKTELASGFVRELVARDATGEEDGPAVVGLATSMKELFAAFFPDKQFLGPQPEPEGSLTFPSSSRRVRFMTSTISAPVRRRSCTATFDSVTPRRAIR